MRTHFFALFTSIGSLTGCSDRAVDVGAPLTLSLSLDGGEKTVSIAGCPPADGVFLDRECMIGSDAKAYVVNGELPVLPVNPPYAVYIHFENGFRPDPDDVTTSGADAAVKAYAGPYNVEGRHPTPEPDESNRVPVRVEMPDERGLVAVVDGAVTTPTQVAIDFDYTKLFSSNPHIIEHVSGFTARFYVGSVPPNDDPCPSSISAPGTAEACGTKGP